MVVIQVLKRKDAASLIIAIALAMIGFAVIGGVTGHLSHEIAGLGDTYNGNFKTNYVLPLVSFVLQLIALEVFLRLIIAARASYDKNQK